MFPSLKNYTTSPSGTLKMALKKTSKENIQEPFWSHSKLTDFYPVKLVVILIMHVSSLYVVYTNEGISLIV